MAVLFPHPFEREGLMPPGRHHHSPTEAEPYIVVDGVRFGIRFDDREHSYCDGCGYRFDPPAFVACWCEKVAR